MATLLHGGRTLTSYEIVITDEQGRRVCTSRLTCLHRDAAAWRLRPKPPATRLTCGPGSAAATGAVTSVTPVSGLI